MIKKFDFYGKDEQVQENKSGVLGIDIKILSLKLTWEEDE